jgi:hypothetical protein
VVSAKDGDTLGVADFQANKESDGFDGVVSTVDVITLKELGRKRNASYAKNAPMNR